MDAVFSVSYRIFRQKWFYLSVAATVFCLWMDLGTSLFGISLSSLLIPALTGTGSTLSLPLLSSLPLSAHAWQEIHSRAAYFAVFRCGFRRYLAGQLAALSLAACLSQFFGLALFSLLLILFGASWNMTAPSLLQLGLLLSCRLLAAVSFAHLGCIGALLAKDSACALVVPVAFSVSLALLADRFFSGQLDAVAFLVPSLLEASLLEHSVLDSSLLASFAFSPLVVLEVLSALFIALLPFFAVTVLCLSANGLILYLEVRRHA